MAGFFVPGTAGSELIRMINPAGHFRPEPLYLN
jgi:hypothetical protein